MAKKNIPEGFINLILSKAKIASKEIVFLSDSRMKICKECPSKSKENVCMECGCYLPAKTKSKRETCPLKKW
tara:strand:+ start:5301 stop:5516 length:216 start_codon:yes stop_codon:yes gene_type:complete